MPEKLSLLICMMMLPFLSEARPRLVLVDAEAFADRGGWVIDQQSGHILGSPYLMAHGAGKPVADAVTEVALPHPGEWHAYVRTYNWTSPWHDGEGPGAFRLIIDGRPSSEVLGTEGNSWNWQYAGSFCGGETISVALSDLTGFDGRCDLICFTDRRCPEESLPNDRKSLDRLRRKLDRSYMRPAEKSSYDIVVAGAGLAGISTAVSAARLGMKVALVHDRPVLGGNNSTEIRVRIGGGICRDPYPNLGNLLLEYAHDETRSAAAPENYQEWKKEAIIANEPGITLLRNYRVVSARTIRGRIRSVDAREITGGRMIRLSAPLFADCTGDGNLGALAGADFKVGRESKAEFGESMAPDKADNNVIGATVQWHTKETDAPSTFPEFNYGIGFSDSTVHVATEGRWDWENGWDKDMVDDVERIRDLELLAIYSNWSYLKNHSAAAADFARRELDWVQHLLGKRESRRLLGDVILNQNDLESKEPFPDAAVTTTWDIDLHVMNPKNHERFPGREFRAASKHKKVGECTIPYRCFYSRNIRNLFMAGRDISVTHVALGATRVMRTNSMMGEVVGMAASICKRQHCLPRDVYEDHLDELKALMSEGVGKKGQPNTQEFYLR